ncbi:MAG: KEOPS complex kinase/ATPase Bud32 [Candidatus ainarchaeum sp.]|nr:KEOPS complex kinase/ATPase Bud32 [Candidatus ainarchaeum sp.]
MKELNRNGAEAIVQEVLFNGVKVVSKKRLPKKYRNKNLDGLIRKRRTKSESKILRFLFNKINVPEVIFVDEKKFEIFMSLIKGKVLKKIIEKNNKLCVETGKEIKKIHDLNIIHGDLTTSNIIFYNKKLFFIDFGLGFFSNKIEDKATDLIVFKKTFNATHSSIKKGWEKVLSGYKPSKEIIERMQKIEKRVRYH